MTLRFVMRDGLVGRTRCKEERVVMLKALLICSVMARLMISDWRVMFKKRKRNERQILDDLKGVMTMIWEWKWKE